MLPGTDDILEETEDRLGSGSEKTLIVDPMLKLKQDQVWKIDEGYMRILHLERLSVTYKSLKDLTSRDGTHHEVSKKEFTRLIKSGSVLSCEEISALGKPM